MEPTLLPESAAKRSAAARALRVASVIMSGLMEFSAVNLYVKPLARVTAEDDSFLQQLRGFLRGGRDLVDARGAHRDLLLHDVAMRCAGTASVFVGLGIDDADDAEFDFRSLNALFVQKLQDRFLVGLGLGINRCKFVASFLVSGQMARSDFT